MTIKLPNVVVVMGRCARDKQSFGIRFEEATAGAWRATWAFPVDDATGKREGYESSRIQGSFEVADEFPGCPHCSNQAYVLCSCDRLNCWSGETSFTCAFCGASGVVEGTIDTLSAGGDR